MSQPPASDDETNSHDALAQFLKDVKPIKPHGRVELSAPKPAPIPKQRLQDEQQVLHDSLSDEWDPTLYLESDETLSFRRNGIAFHVIKQLRTGKWSVQAQLDLHGLRSNEASLALSQFIQDCTIKGRRCVRIIHGKGLGSVGGQPVLKIKVRRWLMQKQEVLAYCQAQPRDGGAGAVLVLLKA